MNKNLVILITAFNPPTTGQLTAFGEKRTKQYVEGLQRVVELSKNFPGFDYVIIDNTIAPGWNMPPELEEVLSRIPNLTRVFFFDNELGAKNKGSGVVVDLKHGAAAVNFANYDYCIYYEPRQYLVDFSFFETFQKHPDNYALFNRYRVTASTKSKFIRLALKVIPVFRQQINVSLFSLTGKLWTDYLNQVDERRMAENKISMEDDLYGFVRGKAIRPLKRVGVRWHNAANNQYYDY